MTTLLLSSFAFPADTILTSFGPLAVSARDSTDNTALFLGGAIHKGEPEQIYLADLADHLAPKAVLHQKGYYLNYPAAIRPLGSETINLFFARAEASAADACQKAKEPLEYCQGFAAAREIGLATSDDNGKSFKFQQVVVNAKNSGDTFAPGRASALFTGKEIWLYYTTTNPSLAAANIFRLRLSPDGKKRLAEPEAVQLKDFTLSLKNIQIVRLRCDSGGKFVATLTGNTLLQDKIPLFISEDGLHFRRASESLVTSSKNIVNPTQLPGPASVEECQAMSLSGVKTARDLVYSEQSKPGEWLLQRVKLSLTFP